MSTRNSLVALAFMLIFSTGCEAPWRKDSARMSAQDTAEAVRIKALLIEAPELAGSAIDVTFDGGKVILDGFVERSEQRRRAQAITLRHGPVEEVVNRIEVR